MLSTARKSPPRCEYLCVPPFDSGEGHCNGKDGNDGDDEDNEDEDILWTAVTSNGLSRVTLPAFGWH